ncbi:MAG: hypothetical protein V4539_03875 [Bacteroidota bacterium]
MKKCLILSLTVCLHAFLFSQETDTRNITPFTQNSALRFDRIASNADGTKVIMSSDGSNAPMVVFKNDGLFWKDITRGICVKTATMIAVDDKVIYVLGKGFDGYNTLCWTYGGGGWTKYNISDDLSGDIRGIAVGPVGDIVAAGIFGDKDGKYYGGRKHNGKWIPFPSRKTEPEVLQWFETGTIQRMVTSGKEDVFVEVDDPSHKTAAILQWTGKKWQMAGDVLTEMPSSMAADSKGNLYLSGNYQENNTDCILKWDGKKRSSIPVPGFRNGMFKYLAIDKNDRLLVGGWLATADKYQIVTMNGSGWDAFGEAPKYLNRFTVGGEKIYAVGDVENKGVYLVPEGGKITGITASLPGIKPDKLPAEVYAAFESYQAKVSPGLDQYEAQVAPLATVRSVKEVGKKKLMPVLTLMNDYLSPGRNYLTDLKLERGDNAFADLLLEAIDGLYGYFHAIYDDARETDNTFYNTADFERNRKIIRDWDTLRHVAARKLYAMEDAYVAKYHIVRRDLLAEAKKANANKPHTNISAIIEANVKMEEDQKIRNRPAFYSFKSQMKDLSSLKVQLPLAESESLTMLTRILEVSKAKMHDANPGETEQRLAAFFEDYINTKTELEREVVDFAKFLKSMQNQQAPQTEQEKKGLVNTAAGYESRILNKYQSVVQKAAALNTAWRVVNPASTLIVALER